MKLRTLALLVFLPLFAYPQGAVLSPPPQQQWFDNNGHPLSFGYLYSYQAGTSTPQSTYADSTGTVANQNPLQLDASGRANVWLGSGLSYKLILQDSSHGTIWTIDNVSAAGNNVVTLDGTQTITGSKTFNGATTTIQNLVISGSCSGCGGGGSPGGADTQLQYNSAGTFAGSGNLTWNNTSQLLTITASGAGAPGLAIGTGYVQADAGFLATPSTALQYNAIQAPGGGMAAKSFTASGYIQVGSGASSPTLTSGDTLNPGALYYNTGSGLQVYNGSAWVAVGGGGSGTPGGASTNVQFNSSGAFGGSGNFTWNNGSQLLTVTAASSANAGIAVATGYMQADAGFYATSGTALQYNAIQAPGGGMAAKSFTATKYIQVGNGSSSPSATSGDTLNAGALYYNNSSGLQVYNGSTWGAVGGSGTPGGSNTQVQYNSSGSLAGSANFTWNNGSQLLTVTATSSSAAGIAVGSGYVQADAGFLATGATATNYNAIQAPGGGMSAINFTATKYIQTGQSSGAPSPTTNDSIHAGAMYWDTGTSAEKLYNGSSWVSLSTGGSTPPGGSDTNLQYNSAGSFAGSSSLTWSNASKLLSVSALNSASAGIAVANGYVQADAGFYATAGTATAYNAIQAPGGGMAAKSFTATKYVQTGNGTSDPTPTTSDTINAGAMYWNTSLGQERVFNGSSWTSLGGGGSTPGGSNTSVQYNASGAFGGSANFTYNSASQLLTVNALSSASAGLAVGNGYVQADAGFLATSGTAINYNSVQAPGGGMSAKSFTAANYIQSGSAFGTPSLTNGDFFHPGALYWNSSLGAEQVYNGSSWVSLATSGGSTVTSVAGTANQVLVNGGTTAQTGAVTLTLPQSIGTSSTPTFSAVIANGVFNSTVTGATVGLQVNGGQFQAFGNGNVNAGGNVNAIGGFQINGVQAINSSNQFVGNGVNVGSNGISAGGYNVVGGYSGQTWTIGFSSPFTINGSGSYTQLIFRGGVLVSAN